MSELQGVVLYHTGARSIILLVPLIPHVHPVDLRPYLTICLVAFSGSRKALAVSCPVGVEAFLA